MEDFSWNQYLSEDALEEAKREYKKNNPDAFVEIDWIEIT